MMRADLEAGAAEVARSDAFWVFGYGSLMWRPGFAAVERQRARLSGYHRAFCVSSTVHRGSPRRPGLVLGLDHGRACDGIAYRVAPEHVRDVRHYLRARELISGVYRETFVPVSLPNDGGRIVHAIAYIVERAHPSYVDVDRLGLAKTAEIIRGAKGQSGVNLDYLINTVDQLRSMGIRERELERLVARAAGYVANRPSDGLVRPGAEALRRVAAQKPDDIRRMRLGDRRRFLYRYAIADG